MTTLVEVGFSQYLIDGEADDTDTDTGNCRLDGAADRRVFGALELFGIVPTIFDRRRKCLLFFFKNDSFCL